MSLNARETTNTGNGGNHPVLEAGSYPGRLVQLIDLGVQDQREYEGKVKPPIQTMMTTYEMSDEFMVDEDGKADLKRPLWQHETLTLYNLSSEMANSTKRYLALDPDESKKGDWTQLLGSPVIIVLTKSDRNKAKTMKNYIGSLSVMRPKESDKLDPLVRPTKLFLLDKPDMEVFYSLPAWVQDVIKKNHNFEGSDFQRSLDDYKKPVDDTKDDVEDEDGW